MGGQFHGTTSTPQAAVLTLTKGPVCPSDKIGRANRDLIMRSAMADGTLLQPSRPATQLDMMFVDAVFWYHGSATG